ncbi:MAG: formylglycine-generating enzyme family protein [Desulfobacter sp.]|nr:MAG: formylglycine-generating enzyme family protein [Desulfobacter sp.]
MAGHMYCINLKGIVLGIAAVCLWCLMPAPQPAAAGENRISNDMGMTFIRVEPGSFIMGSPITEPLRDRDEILHEVTIPSAFYLQETEVTVKQWRAVMGTPWIGKRKSGEDMPVTRVSWYDCIKYIKKITLKTGQKHRLPTEAEWEYACRAGSQTAYSWGDTIDCSKAMYGNNVKKNNSCTPFYKTMDITPDSPAPVKSFPPNPWGFYDMHGNAWEWCADPYRDYMAGPVSDTYSAADSNSRVRRGGSWYKHASYLRSANRTYAHPAAKFKTTGFRLVLEAD